MDNAIRWLDSKVSDIRGLKEVQGEGGITLYQWSTNKLGRCVLLLYPHDGFITVPGTLNNF